jgi:uncharacterized protein (DUF2336 family)
MTTDTKFGLLLDLARATGAEKRRELLLTITDAFLSNAASRTAAEGELYDDVVAAVTADMSSTVRSELARRLAGRSGPFNRTALRLAMDVIEVAQPILERSPALADPDLVKVVETRGDEHKVAVTKRPDLSESVSSTLVEKGSDKVVAALLSNQTARIDRATYERVAERAFSNVALHIPFVRHRRVPPDLLQEIFLTVEQSLRREILARFRDLDPSELEAAMSNGRKRLSNAYAALPEDMEKGRIAVDRLEAMGRLRPAALVDFLRNDQRAAFLVAFSRLTSVEPGFILAMIDRHDVDALATLCRSAGFERALFLSLAIQVGGQNANAALARQLGQLYDEVPIEAARRVVRFWKLRAKDASKPAAA